MVLRQRHAPQPNAARGAFCFWLREDADNAES